MAENVNDERLSTIIGLLGVMNEKQENTREMLKRIERDEEIHKEQHALIIQAMHEFKHEIELMSNEMREHRKDTAILLPLMSGYTTSLSLIDEQLRAIKERLTKKEVVPVTPVLPKPKMSKGLIIAGMILSSTGVYKIFEFLLKGMANG